MVVLAQNKFIMNPIVRNRFLKLELFAVSVGYQIYYFFDERIMGPRKGAVPPPRGCEVCVKNLPMEILEDYLYYYFLYAGSIYKIRLVLTKNKLLNAGTAYITFDNYVGVQRALLLNNAEIYPGFKIVVELSNDNSRIYLRGIPYDVKKKDLWIDLIKMGVKGIVDVIMYRSYTNKEKNRGFVFIEFSSHQVAKKQLLKFQGIRLFGNLISVNWANPDRIRNGVFTPEEIKVLYFKGISLEWDQASVQNYLQLVLGNRTIIQHVFKKLDFAFVQFNTRRDAQMALELFKDHMIRNNLDVQVKWGKPRSGRNSNGGLAEGHVCNAGTTFNKDGSTSHYRY